MQFKLRDQLILGSIRKLALVGPLILLSACQSSAPQSNEEGTWEFNTDRKENGQKSCFAILKNGSRAILFEQRERGIVSVGMVDRNWALGEEEVYEATIELKPNYREDVILKSYGEYFIGYPPSPSRFITALKNSDHIIFSSRGTELKHPIPGIETALAHLDQCRPQDQIKDNPFRRADGSIEGGNVLSSALTANENEFLETLLFAAGYSKKELRWTEDVVTSEKSGLILAAWKHSSGRFLGRLLKVPDPSGTARGSLENYLSKIKDTCDDAPSFGNWQEHTTSLLTLASVEMDCTLVELKSQFRVSFLAVGTPFETVIIRHVYESVDAAKADTLNENLFLALSEALSLFGVL